MSSFLIYAGAIIIIIWGIAHIIPTKNVVKGFGALSEDNRRIIIMEWIAGGLAQCFIGVLILLVTIAGLRDNADQLVYWASAVMLVVLAVLTALTGSRTAIVPMKMCPVVNLLVAVLLVLGIVIK